MILGRKRNKYGNVQKKLGAVIYDSQKEAMYATQLQYKKLAGEIKDWAGQHCLKLELNGQHIANYFVDFVVTLNTGEIQYHEVKGFATDVWKLKWKMAQAIYGKEKFVLIK